MSFINRLQKGAQLSLMVSVLHAMRYYEAMSFSFCLHVVIMTTIGAALNFAYVMHKEQRPLFNHGLFPPLDLTTSERPRVIAAPAA